MVCAVTHDEKASRVRATAIGGGEASSSASPTAAQMVSQCAGTSPEKLWLERNEAYRTIAMLRAEIERLRAALETIRFMRVPWTTMPSIAADALRAADVSGEK